MAEVPKVSFENGEDTKSYVNGDTDKEVLAPSEGPREELIQTAVKFLQNTKVRSSPLAQKKIFLEKKGLTQEEINIAAERSGVNENLTSAPEYATNENQTTYPPHMSHSQSPPGMALMPVNYPPPVPIPPQSRWAKMRDLTVTTVVVASVSYTVYQLFQTYLRPLILGKSAHEKRIERLESQVHQMHQSVSDSMAEMTRTLQAIQGSIDKQPIQPIGVTPSDGKAISDLKSDIASLKGLLLNRNQFPPAPVTSPMLPLWQRTSTSSNSLNTNTTDQSPPIRQTDSSSLPSMEASEPQLANEASPGSLESNDGDVDLSGNVMNSKGVDGPVTTVTTSTADGNTSLEYQD